MCSTNSARQVVRPERPSGGAASHDGDPEVGEEVGEVPLRGVYIYIYIYVLVEGPARRGERGREATGSDEVGTPDPLNPNP